MIDNHLHVKKHRPENSPLLIEETILSAIKMGLKTITITEHFTLPDGFEDPGPIKTNSLSEGEFDYLVDTLEVLQKKFSEKIEILIGAEVDWLPDYQKQISERLKKYDLDFINGSVHFLGTYIENHESINLSIDTSPELFQKGIDINGGIQNFVTNYYKTIQSLVSSNLFDNCAHLDLVKKFNENNCFFNPKESWYIDIVEETLQEIAKFGLSIESNTAGLIKACKEFYPSVHILKRAFELDIPLTIGADAHIPDVVGFEVDNAIKLAKEIGYKEICKYIGRERKFIKI